MSKDIKTNEVNDQIKKIQSSFGRLKRATRTLNLKPQSLSNSSSESSHINFLPPIKKKKKKQNSCDLSKEKFFCDICNNGISYLDRNSLNKHKANHGDKKCACTFPGCTASFKDKNKLKRHSIIHTGEKPYKCDVCGKKFGLEFNMKIHKRIHNGDLGLSRKDGYFYQQWGAVQVEKFKNECEREKCQKGYQNLISTYNN